MTKREEKKVETCKSLFRDANYFVGEMQDTAYEKATEKAYKLGETLYTEAGIAEFTQADWEEFSEDMA